MSSIGSYDGLKLAVQRYMGQDNLDDRFPIFVDIAESRIVQRVKLRAQESFVSRTITAGDSTAALPTTFYGMRSVHIVSTPNYALEYVTPEMLNNYTSTAGRPKVFTVRGLNMLFPCEADSTYVVRIHYYGKVDSLSTGSQTNWLTDNAPHVMLYGVLQAAAEYVNDPEQEQRWGALFDQSLKELAESDARQTYGPIPTMRTETQRW